MSSWRPVDVRLWDDRKFLGLSQDARYLWLYLLTCPSLPLPGVILGGDAAIAEQLGWTPERFRERLIEIRRIGIQVAREGRIVWLKHALKYQPPANPNMVKGWSKKWDDVPEGELKAELWEALKIACKPWSILFGKLFAKPFGNGSTNGSTNGSGNGSAHEHQHDHKHQHDHDPEKKEDLPLTRDPALPSTAPAPDESQPIRPELPENPDPEPETQAPDRDPKPQNQIQQPERTDARTLMGELEQARQRAAAQLGVAIQPLPFGDRGERDLADLLASARSQGAAAVELVVSQTRHAIAMAELETTRGEKSLEWFTGAVFSPGNWRRLVGKTAKQTARAGPRSSAERAPQPRIRPKVADEIPPD